jgi:hypothetical protein
LQTLNALYASFRSDVCASRPWYTEPDTYPFFH